MRFTKPSIAAIGYELPAQVVSSLELEERLAPLYKALRIQPGQLEALTGIRERRYWESGVTMAGGAARAGAKALRAAGVAAGDIGMLIYGGVCRDHLEPATACAAANALGLGSNTQIYDVSNACLGVINGIVQAAGAIELGHIRAALVVSCESARQIVDLTIERMLAEPTMENFRWCLATLTGGSGAIGVVVCDSALAPSGHRLLGGVIRSRTKYHELCRWGPDTGIPPVAQDDSTRRAGSRCHPMRMDTDAAGVLEHGVELGVETWYAFLEEMGWTAESIERTICHQVGAPHRETVMKALGVPLEKDFPTYEFLGNIGTVSLPITAAIAEERGVLERGHRTAFCGIGSGLNCLILGVEW